MSEKTFPQKVKKENKPLSVQDVLLPLDLDLSLTGTAIFTNRGRCCRFFRKIKWFLWLNYLKAILTVICGVIDNSNFVATTSSKTTLYILSDWCYYILEAVFILIMTFRRRKISELLERSFHRMSPPKKTLLRRFLWIFLLFDLLQHISFFYGLCDYLGCSLDDPFTHIFFASFGDWILPGLVLYVIVIEAIKDKDVFYLQQVRVSRSPNKYQALIVVLQETQELVDEVNSTLAFIPLICYGFIFVTVPGTLSQLQKRDSLYKDTTFWLRTEGGLVLGVSTFLLLAAYVVGDRKARMAAARNVLIKDITLSAILTNDKMVTIDCLRQNNYRFMAVFFEVKSSLVLSFIGSIISFTVLFLQLESTPGLSIIEPANVNGTV